MEEQRSAELIPSGVPGLDHVLGGGLRSGRLYFVEGESGTGKTTLALQFVREGSRRGETSLVVSLSETAAELQTAASSHGWSLDGIEMHDLTDVGNGGGAPVLFHLSETALDERVHELLRLIDQIRPQRMMLDTLSSLRTLSDQPGRLRRHLELVQRRVDAVGCTLLVVDELFGGDLLHPRSLAWGIVRLEQCVGDYGPARRRLFVPKMRGQPYAGGYHDFQIQTGGLEVFPSLQPTECSAPVEVEQSSTGIDALDALLGGGIERGSSLALLGPPGSGKSTLVCQLALASAQRGERVAVFLFDESARTFRLRAESQGFDLTPVLSDGHLLLQRVDPAELSPGQFACTLQRLVVDDGVRFVAIDSLNGYLYSMPDERFMHLHVHELISCLTAYGATVLLTMAQPGPFSSGTKMPVDLSYLADTVVIQRFFEAAGDVRSAISVLKKRHGDHERTIREYRIGANGLSLGAPLSRFRGVLTGVPEYVGETEPLM